MVAVIFVVVMIVPAAVRAPMWVVVEGTRWLALAQSQGGTGRSMPELEGGVMSAGVEYSFTRRSAAEAELGAVWAINVFTAVAGLLSPRVLPLGQRTNVETSATLSFSESRSSCFTSELLHRLRTTF